VGFAPLVVVALWIPILAAAVLLTWGMNWLYRLCLSLPLLFITIGLVRLAWRQVGALRDGRFRYPPYSGAVARLAITLRKKEILRSLHLADPDVTFVAEADQAGPSSRG
jgi:hypothetical protein